MTTIKILNNWFLNSSSLSPLPPLPKWGLQQFPAHAQRRRGLFPTLAGRMERERLGPRASQPLEFFSEPQDEALVWRLQRLSATTPARAA